MRQCFLLVVLGSALAACSGAPQHAAAAWNPASNDHLQPARFSPAVRPGGGAPPESPAPPESSPPVEISDLAVLPELVRPTDPRVQSAFELRMALEALAEGRAREAAMQIEALGRSGADPRQVGPLHAWALVQAGEPENALALARQARNPGETSWMFVQAQALYQLERRVEAFPYYRKCLAAEPKSAELLVRAAECALAAGEAAEALSYLDRYVVAHPLTAELRLLRARVLAAAGRPESALDLYEQLLAGEPEDPALWDEAGMAAFSAALAGGASEEFERAAACFAAAAQLDPQEARYQYNLACALDWGQDPTEAEAAYRRALELNPGHLKAAENLVELCLRQERVEEARHVLRQQLRQPLSSADAARVEQRLASLAGAPGDR